MSMNNFFGVFIISIFYALCFGFLWNGIESAQEAIQSSSWPTTRGKITYVFLREEKDDERINYEVEVRYHYSVMGETYTSSRLAFGYAASIDRKKQRDILNKLERASSVNVRYDPKDPSRSTLSLGIHSSIIFILVCTITWLSFIFGCTLFFWFQAQAEDIILKNIEVNSIW